MNAQPPTTENPTILYRLTGSFMVLVHGKGAPSPFEWERYLDEVAVTVRRVRLRILVVTDGAGPNAAQRERMNKRISAPLRVAVVTHAVMARRIVSVLAWFNPNIRAFAPADLYAALDYLEVPAEQQAGVIKLVSEMRIQLSGAGVQSVLDPMKVVITRLSQLRENIERSRRS